MKKLLILLLLFTATILPQSPAGKIFYLLDGTTADVTPPTTPTNLLAVGGVTSTILTWDAVTSADLSRYVIYRKATDDSTTSTRLDSVYAGTETKTFTGLTENAVWYWWVITVDSSGNRGWYSNGDSAQVTPVAPSAPTSLAAVGKAGTNRVGAITLTWTDPADTDLDSVRLYRGSTWVASINEGVQAYLDSSLTSAVYSYTVKALDDLGNLSVASSAASDTVYEFEVFRYLASTTTAMADSMKWKLNTIAHMIKDSLVIDSLTQKFDVLYYFAMATAVDSVNSKKNIAKRSHDMTTGGTCVFTAKQGWKGDGTTGYLNTNYSASTDSAAGLFYNASFGVFVRTEKSENNYMGVDDDYKRTQVALRDEAEPSNLAVNLNSITGKSVGNSSSVGLTSVARNSGDSLSMFKNGVRLTTLASTANAKPTIPFYLCARNTETVPNGYSQHEVSFFWMGAYLTEAQQIKLCNIFEWALDGYGTGVLAGLYQDFKTEDNLYFMVDNSDNGRFEVLK